MCVWGVAVVRAVWRSGQRVDFMDKVDERVVNVANRAISSQCDLLYWQVRTAQTMHD